MSDFSELESSNQTSTQLKKREGSCYFKRKGIGAEMFLESGRPFLIVTSEISDGSEEENVAVSAGSVTVG